MKTDQGDFTDQKSFLPFNLMKEICTNPEAFIAIAQRLPSIWNSWKDSDLYINVLIQPII